ncbi:Endo/exonuclease/phosphatase domain-containing protein [Psidium guajava]|nr:Endo/exonuclease/phosphatase domain-containing protein [Psidium guajava]
MGFEAASRPPPPSWLCARSPLSTRLSPSHLTVKPASSFSCKSSPLCCSGDSTMLSSSSSPSTRSYSRRWYNPLRRRPPEDQPSLEIVRRWIEADQPLASQAKFTMVSYNILGDKNASKHRDLYTNIPSPYMKWERRKRVICEELIGWNPDIICLQEVDKYFELSKILERAGYVGSYKGRTGDAVDGCAIFWKANEFWLLEEESINFKELGLRDNVAQLFVFQACKAESKHLLVGNIHVLYNPSRGDVKLGQIRHLSSRAHILSEKWGSIPVLLAGDFNTTPQSAIYKFLSTSKLDIMSYDRRELSGQRSCHPAQVFGEKQDLSNSLLQIDRFLTCGWTDEEIKTAGGSAEGEVVAHPLYLKSSYATIRGSARTRDSNGEPLATSYHSKFFGTVDYIWYSKGLVPTRVLDTPPVDILRRTGGLPCKKVGSDHLALVSEFAFTQDNDVGEGTLVATSRM